MYLNPGIVLLMSVHDARRGWRPRSRPRVLSISQDRASWRWPWRERGTSRIFAEKCAGHLSDCPTTRLRAGLLRQNCEPETHRDQNRDNTATPRFISASVRQSLLYVGKRHFGIASEKSFLTIIRVDNCVHLIINCYLACLRCQGHFRW